MTKGSTTERLPLAGKTIVVTRRKEQAKEFSDLLEQVGASVILFPAVEIAEPSSWSECDTALERLNDYSGIIFTSANAVEYFFRRVAEQRKSSQMSSRMYAVGEKTKEKIESFGFHTEEIPAHFSAEQLAREMVQRVVTGKRFLFPKGNLAKKDIERILSSHGAFVENVVVYRTQEPELNAARKMLLSEIKGRADLITFFSPSSVIHFLNTVPKNIVDAKDVAVFGETTANAAREKGLTVAVAAERSTIEAFLETIRDFYTTVH